MKLALAFCWIGLGSCWAQVIVCDEQHWRNPMPHGLTMNDVIRTRGYYYAVGSKGLIQKSLDGITWQTLDTPRPKRDLNAIVDLDAGSSLSGMLAVGDSGAILHSTDGVTWQRHSNEFSDLYAIVQGGGTFFAIGEHGDCVVHQFADQWAEV